MKISAATKPSPTDALVCFRGSESYTALPASIRERLDALLASNDCAVVPSLGLYSAPLIAAAAVPDANNVVAQRRCGGALARALSKELVAQVSLVCPDELAHPSVFIQGFAQGAYHWDRYRSTPTQALRSLRVIGVGKKQLERATVLAENTARCRDMINTPAEDMGPAEFVRAARSLCKGTGLRVTVLDEATIVKAGMGLLHGVGRASPRRPRLLRIDWPGRGKPLALCGKGVCFDTGGLDIKSATSMELMRKDMGGAATVLAAMISIARCGSKQAVRAYLPLVDNAIDGNAFRPGDILRAMNGTTVEIGNTDAEGRLVLADAICQAKADGAQGIVTVATLTGAAMVALGRVRVPIMGTNETLLAGLESAAEACGERVWRMPFDDDFHRLLRSPNADLCNVGGPEGGCITAGCFLAHFAGDTPFAHCDISPASWQTREHDLGPIGATGTLVATLAALGG
ncbi:MAG: leucyl aminopeptidase family protein [Planctomycetota bacterium]|jgi:leucyl aminopeptidase|nr:leucyl aminopeptidase family protein [Planctomycetota bacterium]